MEFGTPARFWHPSPAPTKSAAVPGLGLFPMQGRDHHPLTDGMRESAARGMLCLLRRRDAPARSPQDPVKSMVTPINTSPTSLGFWVPTALRDRVLQKFSRSGRRTRKWILARTIPGEGKTLTSPPIAHFSEFSLRARNTIPSSAVYSVPSAETGRASRSKVTRRS